MVSSYDDREDLIFYKKQGHGKGISLIILAISMVGFVIHFLFTRYSLIGFLWDDIFCSFLALLAIVFFLLGLENIQATRKNNRQLKEAILQTEENARSMLVLDSRQECLQDVILKPLLKHFRLLRVGAQILFYRPNHNPTKRFIQGLLDDKKIGVDGMGGSGKYYIKKRKPPKEEVVIKKIQILNI